MSKQTIRKFRKNDWTEEEEVTYNPRNHVNKFQEKRVDRALRTKDITALLEDEESDYPYDSIYDEMADEDSWPEDDERR